MPKLGSLDPVWPASELMTAKPCCNAGGRHRTATAQRGARPSRRCRRWPGRSHDRAGRRRPSWGVLAAAADPTAIVRSTGPRPGRGPPGPAGLAGRRPALHQRIFAPSWTIRPGRADVTTPKFAEVMFCDTPANCGWLNALKASTRNCRRRVPGEGEVLEEAQIQVVDAGPSQDAAAGVAEGAERRLGEGGGVEPLLDRAAAGVDVAHDVRPVGAEGVEDASQVSREYRDREATLPEVDPVHLPAADHAPA